MVYGGHCNDCSDELGLKKKGYQELMVGQTVSTPVAAFPSCLSLEIVTFKRKMLLYSLFGILESKVALNLFFPLFPLTLKFEFQLSEIFKC